MSKPLLSVFRREALDHYIRSNEQSILLRFTAPPVLLFLWVLIIFFVIFLVLAQYIQMPVYTQGIGILHNNKLLIFIPVSPAHPFHIESNAPLYLQVGKSGEQVAVAIERVEPGIVSPSTAQQRYGLGNAASQVITGPSIAIIATSSTPFVPQWYEGSIMQASIQVGSVSVLSLFLTSV